MAADSNPHTGNAGLVVEDARGKRQAALAEEVDLGRGAVHTGRLHAVGRGNDAQEEEGKRQVAGLATDPEEGMERAAL